MISEKHVMPAKLLTNLFSLMRFTVDDHNVSIIPKRPPMPENPYHANTREDAENRFWEAAGCLWGLGLNYMLRPRIGVNNEKHWMDGDEIDDGHTRREVKKC